MTGLAAARAAKQRKKSAGHGDRAKEGTQGSDKPAKQRRIAREQLPKFDAANLKYEGEQVELFGERGANLQECARRWGNRGQS